MGVPRHLELQTIRNMYTPFFVRLLFWRFMAMGKILENVGEDIQKLLLPVEGLNLSQGAKGQDIGPVAVPLS